MIVRGKVYFSSGDVFPFPRNLGTPQMLKQDKFRSKCYPNLLIPHAFSNPLCMKQPIPSVFQGALLPQVVQAPHMTSSTAFHHCRRATVHLNLKSWPHKWNHLVVASFPWTVIESFSRVLALGSLPTSDLTVGSPRRFSVSFVPCQCLLSSVDSHFGLVNWLPPCRWKLPSPPWPFTPPGFNREIHGLQTWSWELLSSTREESNVTIAQSIHSWLELDLRDTWLMVPT